jgi:hypothetical protein
VPRRVEFYLAEGLPVDPGDAGVLRKALIHERVIGVDQIKYAAIVVQDGSKEHLRFGFHRRTQALIKILEFGNSWKTQRVISWN